MTNLGLESIFTYYIGLLGIVFAKYVPSFYKRRLFISLVDCKSDCYFIVNIMYHFIISLGVNTTTVIFVVNFTCAKSKSYVEKIKL